jgi:hypothetical protein
MRRKGRGDQQLVQGVMMLPKDVTTHNQVETLSGMFVLLSSALNPAIVPRMDAPPEVVPSALGQGVKTSIETALISVCNRISELAQEPKRWDTGDEELNALYKMSLIAGIESAEQGKKAAAMIQSLMESKPKRNRRGGKGSDEVKE